MRVFRRKRRRASPQRGRRFPSEALTRDEIEAILRVCYDTPAAGRNRALIVVLWRAGLRLGEALALRPQDVDAESGTIRVLHGKGDKARTVGIDRGAVLEVQQWERERVLWNVPRGASLFCNRKGGPLAQAYVRAMLPRLAREAGVEKRVHAHMFRHTYAVELMREGVSLVNIQRLLGHSSAATTNTYLMSLSPEEALDAVRDREW